MDRVASLEEQVAPSWPVVDPAVDAAFGTVAGPELEPDRAEPTTEDP